jgi:hypothetical protein
VVSAVADYLDAWRAHAVAAVRATAKLEKVTKDELERMLQVLPVEARRKLLEELQPYLTDVATAGLELALTQTAPEADLDAMLSQSSQDAIDWASKRAGELVGMRLDEDGNIIENPNPQWRIDEQTRQGIRDVVGRAEAEGWSNDELAAHLEDAYVFSEARAEMIARTETAFADVAGNRIGWQASGVVDGQEWLLSEEPCPACEENAAAGVIGIHEDFPNGGPPAHPNCECDVVPVLKDDPEGEGAA